MSASNTRYIRVCRVCGTKHELERNPHVSFGWICKPCYDLNPHEENTEEDEQRFIRSMEDALREQGF